MFDVAEFQDLRQGIFGSELHYFEELESTNLFGEQLARMGASEGVLVLANSQTRGKGRSGALWYSPRDLNLYFSLILRPRSPNLKYLPFLMALSVIRVLTVHGLNPDLKWPNDVLVAQKKICGILIQTSTEENHLQFAIVGCGVNVNSTDFPPEIRDRATSVAEELGRPVSRESLLASVLLEFEALYEKIDTFSWSDFCSLLEKHSSYIRGCEVRIEQQGEHFEGKTLGLDPYGGLIIDTVQGCRVFYAGEIQSCRRK